MNLTIDEEIILRIIEFTEKCMEIIKKNQYKEEYNIQLNLNF